MKIAICLYGLSPFESTTYGNTYPYSLPIENEYKFRDKSYPSLKSWKNHILDHNDADVYLHSWTTDHEIQKKLIEIFKPIKYEFEPVVHDDIITSCCMSMFKSTELLEGYYDIVLLCRMDVIWFRPIIISETFNPERFSVAYYRWWNRKIYNTEYYGTSDIYFAGNSDNVKRFTNLYNDLPNCPFYKNDMHDHHLIKRWQINNTGLIDIVDQKLNPGLTSDDSVPTIDFNIESRVVSFIYTRIP